MITAVKSIFISIILLLPSLTYAAVNTDYYVTQNGNGLKDGKSLKNAWSVADFNSSTKWSTIDHQDKIDPGDTVNFSGTITSRLVPKGGGSVSGGYVTLDGYAAGDCDPNHLDYTSSACYTAQAEFSGSAGFIGLTYGHDYVIIQDFRATGGGWQSIFRINDSQVAGVSDHIKVRRNYLYNADKNFLVFTRSSGFDGTDYAIIENNKMVGYCKSSDCAQGINFYYTTNLVVRNNDFGGGGSSYCKSDNVIEVHTTQNALFEYNSIHDAYNQAGMAIKEPAHPNNENVIVRFNKFLNNGKLRDQARGIYVGSNSEKIYIYGNFIASNGDYGIDPNREASYIHIWSNIIANNDRAGIATWTNGDYGSVDNIYIYNNTIAHNGTEATGSSNPNFTGLKFNDSGATNIFIRNNILYFNRPNASTYQQFYSGSTNLNGDLDGHYNTYYHPSQNPNFYYSGNYSTLEVMQDTHYLELNSDLNNPGFNDPDGADNTYGTIDDDYTLDGTNMDNGSTLPDNTLPNYSNRITIQGKTYCNNDGGTCDELLSYSMALDPKNTKWSTTPPTVKPTKQENGSWGRGAYVYGYYSKPNSIITLLSPSGFKIAN